MKSTKKKLKFLTTGKVERSLYSIGFSVQENSSLQVLQESIPAPFTGTSFFSTDPFLSRALSQ